MNEHSFQDRERIRRNATYRVSRALANGEMTKPDCCEQCGTEAEPPRRIRHWANHLGRGDLITKLEAHHPDYSRPLDVVWLCRPCHMLADLRGGDVRYGGVAPLSALKPRDAEDQGSDLAEHLRAPEVELEDGGLYLA